MAQGRLASSIGVKGGADTPAPRECGAGAVERSGRARASGRSGAVSSTLLSGRTPVARVTPGSPASAAALGETQSASFPSVTNQTAPVQTEQGAAVEALDLADGVTTGADIAGIVGPAGAPPRGASE